MSRRILARVVEKIRRLQPKGGVGERTVKSGIWAGGINITDRFLSMVMLVVLARYLEPADFGLMGIALLSLAVMQRFTELGFDTALIQRQERNVDAFLDTVWTLKVARGIGITTIAFAVAPFVAALFGEPRATDVIRVIAVSPLLVGLRNPKIVYLQKDLEFHRQFVYKISGSLVQVGVAIWLAITLGNVWALVFGVLSGNVVRSTVSYSILRYVPRPKFDRAQAAELIDYGKWITGLNVFTFLFTQGDDAFVGWYLGAGALGLYQMAYRLARAPSTEVTHVVSRVMLPAYSRIQDDRVLLRTTYLNVLQLTAFVSAPLAVGIVAVSSNFVRTFMGQEWIPMIAVMQVLAVWGFILSVGATSGPLLQAVGRPDYATKATAVKTVLLVVLIFPATEAYGILGTSLAVLGSALVTSEPYITYRVLDELDASFSGFVRAVGIPLVPSILMGLALFSVQTMLPIRPTPLHFLFLVLTGAGTYAGLMALVEIRFDYGIRGLLQYLIDMQR